VTRVAAIDCGTNSIRLLIADVEGGTLTDVVRRMEIVRLGAGVDRTGRIDPAALERTLEATRRYAAECLERGVERIRYVATSATRDAANRQDFVDGVRHAIGVAPEIISGDEEATLSYLGGALVLTGQPEPALVVDIGGGSTELVLGEGGAMIAGYSMDVGSVRMRERHLHTDPPTETELAAARADIHAMLDVAASHVDLGATRTLIGLAGTITTLTGEVLGLDRYRPELINGATTTIEQAQEACAWYLRSTQAERLTRGYLHPGRVDVIAAGALVWSEVMARVQREVEAAGGVLTHTTTSEHDILDGIALSVA
jgi:exopolyphosphatase/guanosine-5'-triphosphate,3'-diphosphate pyrophosphatase